MLNVNKEKLYLLLLQFVGCQHHQRGVKRREWKIFFIYSSVVHISKERICFHSSFVQHIVVYCSTEKACIMYIPPNIKVRMKVLMRCEWVHILYTYMQCVVKSFVSVLFKRLCHFIQVFMLFKKYSAAKTKKSIKKKST